MSIRTQTVITIFLIFSSIIGIIFLISRFALLENLLAIEETNIQQNVERVENILKREIIDLELITSDWSAWDDTYEFMDTGNEEYLDNNLVDETFPPLRLNMILFFDISGELVYGKAYDLQTDEEIELPEGLPDYLKTQGLLITDTEAQEGISGLIHPKDSLPLLMSSLPILTSENEGPANGTLVFARFFDESELDNLGELMFSPISAYCIHDPAIPADIAEMAPRLVEDTSQSKILNEEQIAGYVLINDAFGEPVLILEAIQPREIYSKYRTSLSALTITVSIMGVLYGIVAFYTANKQGISRLRKLSDTAVAIASTGNLTERVPDKGNDEISRLSASLNKMLESLQTSMEKETKLRHNLESEMQNRIHFTRALVHELKTPLTPMLTSSDILVSEMKEEPLLSLAKNINRGAERLNVRIDELLDIARAEIGTLTLDRTHMDISLLVRDIMAEITPGAQQQEITVETDIPETLPPVRGDDDRLRQVLMNILNNACKFTPKTGTIRVTMKEDGTSVTTEVSDTGPGIPPEEQENIFLPYYRSNKDPHNLRGLGLGLALCKMIVELHEGRIWVRNNEPSGSIFGFSIPIYDTNE